MLPERLGSLDEREASERPKRIARLAGAVTDAARGPAQGSRTGPLRVWGD
jgi:hypothetical protein